MKNEHINIVQYVKLTGLLFPIFYFSCGYIHIWILLQYFSIDAYKYFSLADYIAASTNIIMKAGLYVIPFFVALLIYIIKKNEPIDEAKTKSEEKVVKTIHCSGYISLTFLLLFVFVWSIKLKSFLDTFVFLLAIGVFVLAMYFVSTFVKRYLIAYYPAYLIPARAFSIVFLGALIFTALSAKLEAMTIANNDLLVQNTHVHTEKNINFPYSKDKLIPISSNSQYYFLFDKDSREAIILPTSKISYIDVVVTNENIWINILLICIALSGIVSLYNFYLALE